MSYALLFAGQGTQHGAMLPWLESEPASAPMLQALAHALGPDWRVRLQDEPWRHANPVAQVLLTATSLAAWAALEPRLQGPPAVVAGYSAGELAAFACAGAFGSHEAVQLATDRARAMSEAVQGQATGMLSVAGLPEQQVCAVCAQLQLECAIRIAADHVILAGEDAALQAAQAALAARGATCRRLAVQVPSHTSWMQPAVAAFARRLETVPFQPVRCPVALNATGTTARRADVLRAALSRQIGTTVQWGACMDAVAERGPRCVLEVGPGNALARLWAARHPGIPARSVEDFRGPAAIAAWVASG